MSQRNGGGFDGGGVGGGAVKPLYGGGVCPVIHDASGDAPPSSSSLPGGHAGAGITAADPPPPPPFSDHPQDQWNDSNKNNHRFGEQQLRTSIGGAAAQQQITTTAQAAQQQQTLISPLGVRPKRRRMIENAVTKGNRRALYHCNYCNKDISNTYRIKCAVCLDFDLCIECFHVGVEVTPHKKTHHYKVVDNLSFPLFTMTWGADEELLLIEAVEMYGLGNWKEVSDHVGTKSEDECLKHYFEVYYGTDKTPLPDVDNILGPGYVVQSEVTASAAAPNSGSGVRVGRNGRLMSSNYNNNNSASIRNKDVKMATTKDVGANEEIINNRKKKHDDITTAVAPDKSQVPIADAYGKKADTHDHSAATQGGTYSQTITRAKEVDGKHNKYAQKQKREVVSTGKEKKSNTGGEGGNQLAQKQPASTSNTSADPTTTGITGYNFKRQEFDIEHDPEAEVPLADLEINGKEDKEELKMKEKQLLFYYQRQQERYRRRKFVADRGLLDIKRQQGIERRHTREELEIASQYRVFAQYMKADEFETFVQGMINEHYLRQRIEELKELRRNGVTTLVEAEVYERMVKRRETEVERVKAVEEGIASGSGQKTSAARAGRYLGRDENTGSLVATGSLNRELQKLRSNSTTASQLSATLSNRTGNRKPLGTFIDIEGQPGYDVLTERERELCTSCKLLPLFYLKIKQTFIRANNERGSLSRADVQWEKQKSGLIPADNSKLNRVYDFLLQAGLITSP